MTDRRVWVRIALFVLSGVIVVTGPRWLRALVWTLLAVNLVWVVFTARGSQQIHGMKDAGVLPRRLSLKTIRIVVALGLAISVMFLLSALGRG